MIFLTAHLWVSSLPWLAIHYEYYDSVKMQIRRLGEIAWYVQYQIITDLDNRHTINTSKSRLEKMPRCVVTGDSLKMLTLWLQLMEARIPPLPYMHICREWHVYNCKLTFYGSSFPIALYTNEQVISVQAYWSHHFKSWLFKASIMLITVYTLPAGECTCT